MILVIAVLTHFVCPSVPATDDKTFVEKAVTVKLTDAEVMVGQVYPEGPEITTS